jgi:hypothetical protein
VVVGGAPRTAGAIVATPMRNARVEGRAVIGKTNEIEIKALAIPK